MPAAPMAADPSPAAMAVDAVPPAAEPGTSQPDAGTGGEQQQQRSEEAAPTPTASQETGDVMLVYKGQEHTFVGVPQRRVPSHPDITTPCTWMCSPCATLARLLRNQAFVVCSPGSCSAWFAERRTTLLPHWLMCSCGHALRLHCCWSCWKTAPTSTLCSRMASLRRSTARCSPACVLLQCYSCMWMPQWVHASQPGGL